MASGRPDFHPSMLLEGRYSTSLIPVLVDALGQLYTIISGSYGGVPTPILLDAAGRILAHLVGNDAGTIRDVTVDATGKMIIRVQGNDGTGTLRDVRVDTDGVMKSRMQGAFGGALKDVAVNTDGNLLAIIQGLYGATLKTIAVDANGVMKANLAVQDLNFLKFRPVYGDIRSVKNTSIAINPASWSDALNVAGKGAVFGGFFRLSGALACNQGKVRAIVDGVTNESSVFTNMLLFNQNLSGLGFFWMQEYDDVNFSYTVGIQTPITFESTCVISMYNPDGSNRVVSYEIVYALVP